MSKTAWPVMSLQATPNPSQKAVAGLCPDCRAKAEQLRDAASLLVLKATHQDLVTAKSQFLESARLFRQIQSPRDAAQDYLYVGEIYSIWGRQNLALQMYERAFELITENDIDLRCSILSHKALAYLDSNLPRSLELANQAVSLSKDAVGPSAKAEALEAFGQAWFAQKQPEKALEAFHTAVRLFREAKDLNKEAGAWLGVGYAAFHKESGYAEASEAYKEALRLWTSAANRHGVALAHSAMGLYWTQTGEFQKAMDEYNQAQSIFHAAGDLDNEAVMLNGHGNVSAAIGNYEDSLRCFKKARSIFAAFGDQRGEIGAIDGASDAEWMLHLPNLARQSNELELRLAIRHKLPRYEASANLGLADYAALRGDYKTAYALYVKARDLYGSLGDTNGQAKVLIRLGHLFSQNGQNEQAFSSLREVLRIAERSGRVTVLARAHFEIAMIYQRQHQLEDAKNETEIVLQIIESQRTKVSDFDDRASYFASVHEYYQLYIDTLMQLDRQNPGKDFARKALEAAEKSKVRSLLDMLGFVSSALPLNAIQAEIRGDNAVILEYAIGKENSYLWVIGEDSMIAHELPSSTGEILRLYDSFHASLIASGIHPTETPKQEKERKEQAARYARDQRDLAKDLLGPAIDFLQGRRVIIVPDGFLQYVPFSALLPFDVRDFVLLPSASTLKALRDAAQRRAPPNAEVAVFADPVFEKDDWRVTGNSSFRSGDTKPDSVKQVARDVLGSSYIPRLPNSHYEAEAIVKAFSKGTVFLREGFDANRKTALQILSSYRFIHFATHEFLDTRHPELSGLVLSMVRKNGRGQDGYLRLKDIYQLKLSAELVVLSACESALGKDLESEGMIGLTRGFLYAGSSRIISTLWKVDDGATAKLMTSFYGRLRKGEAPSLALRGAQSDLAKIPEWKHPYYWAAFVLQGEYRWSNDTK
ncbi:MAG TPA: CHAT domain-containing tetratricopeptide repeat protein [Candidatus Angelobacter sp.]|nr:CHAT domain-containing tetratricopeptide repeat protein [Candidatus Angelobacter sp.]